MRVRLAYFEYFGHVLVSLFTNSRTTQIKCYCTYQRWSRGRKARGLGQSQAHKKIRGQGQLFRGETLSRPRTGMLEAKDFKMCPRGLHL